MPEFSGKPNLHQVQGCGKSDGSGTDEFIGLQAKHEAMLTGLAPGQTYHFWVITQDWSGGTNYWKDMTFDTPAVRAPTYITAHGVGDRAVLGWEPIFGPGEYIVYRSRVPGGP